MDADVPAEIVIVAPRLPEAPSEDTYATFEIDPAALANATRLDEALRTAPGVALFRRNDSAAANPTIQGLSVRAIAPSGAGRALVTLDGLPLNDPFGGWVIWGQLPPETIAGATVLRGAGAGPYGAGALTGVVQLEERRGQGAALSVEGGEDGYARASVFAEGGEDALSFMLAASMAQSDGWVPVHERRGAADTALWSDSAAGVARVQWRGDDLVFAARLGGYSEQRSAGLVGAESTSEGASLSLTLAAPRGPFAWRVQGWALTSDLANSSVSVAPDRSATTPANNQLHTPAVGWGGNAAVRWTEDDRGLELGADLRTADGETRERFSFVGGAFTRSRVAGGKTLTAGVYAETWRVLGPWLLSGGARVDVTRARMADRVERLLATGAPTLQFAPEDSETIAPTARFGFRRGLGAMFVRGAAYSGFRPPTLNELHRPFRVGNDVTEANAALEPERLYGADFGVGADHGAWSWNAGVFVNRLDDAIVNVTLGAGPGTFPPGVFVPADGAYRQRQNAGRIDAVGVEADARVAVSDALSWRAAFAYTDAEVDGGDAAPGLTGLRPAQAPEWTASAGVRWRAFDATTLSADVIYESERFEDDLNTRVLSAATVLDLRVEQRLSPLASVYLALDNALDADVETAETADGTESFAPPRALRVGLRLGTPR
ncbi:TonB-dependent receptor [Terricaulis silvestris]|uniref:Ferrichrome receptor protein n=1 Tax=Terricaulis silvestris TaxID=2686094 RepID=A0A6I6MPJ9_9CAUL|nr:TonB-dependent receptor [Terricaulis silvestris]QGZ93502.1 ferrichrome receptor precursor protein [Terricaulis silvestris]